MSNGSYPSASKLDVSAGAAVKFGFFAALGATLFSLILSVVIGIAFFVLTLLGVGVFSLFNS